MNLGGCGLLRSSLSLADAELWCGCCGGVGVGGAGAAMLFEVEGACGLWECFHGLGLSSV